VEFAVAVAEQDLDRVLDRVDDEQVALPSPLKSPVAIGAGSLMLPPE
jgi:hypothetical protein